MAAKGESLLIYLIKSIKGGIREVLSYNMGRVSLVIILFMVIASAYAIATLPNDFPSMWRNAAGPPWIYNPKGAPPFWVKYLGVQVADTVDYKRVEAETRAVIRDPKEIERLVPETGKALGVKPIELIGYAQVYRVTYMLERSSYPQDILVLFNAKSINMTQIRVNAFMYLTRPDGVILNVGRLSVGLDKLPGIHMKTTYEYFALAYIESFKLNRTIDEMTTLYVKAMFGVPVKPGAGELKPLLGEYQITLLLLFTGLNPVDIKRIVDNLDITVDIRVIGSAYGLLGTDSHGRDLFQGVLFGFPVALAIGVLVSLAIVVIGLTLGVISGYFGGRVDEVIQRLVDVLVNIPVLPILILIGVAIQTRGLVGWPAMFIIMATLVLLSWGGVTIITRSMALSIKAEPYIEAARALGASTFRILFRHIVPQLIPYAMAVLVFNVPAAIIAEAGLSILGIDHGLPTWGRILADAQIRRDEAYPMWWWILPPGLLLGLYSFAFVALGFTLETIVEPRLRRR